MPQRTMPRVIAPGGYTARDVLRGALEMTDHDDVRFSSFTRDLARRHRRPRSYPPPPTRADALEQLCGGSTIVVAPPNLAMLPRWADDLSDLSDLDMASEAS